MPLDGTDFTDHPAATLTPSERVEAIAYLEWLDDHWTIFGKEGWFQGSSVAEGARSGSWHGNCSSHCLTTPQDEVDGVYHAVRAMGLGDLSHENLDAAVCFNNDSETTFTMVHTRVKDTLAVLRILEASDAI